MKQKSCPHSYNFLRDGNHNMSSISRNSNCRSAILNEKTRQLPYEEKLRPNLHSHILTKEEQKHKKHGSLQTQDTNKRPIFIQI